MPGTVLALPSENLHSSGEKQTTNTVSKLYNISKVDMYYWGGGLGQKRKWENCDIKQIIWPKILKTSFDEGEEEKNTPSLLVVT